ncbi:MAG TPA: 4-(cytidine 5'-diphospho)-2-C-methyl-D-erythritol kinase [Acidimicrobiia bacterium]|nr:4-(cytidine 5'-diphospho)-2-C-methyl-D-erythritol kinase [Acidimicrobiia bacterium]
MIRATANAKVNLGLRVGRVRPDGFHPLSSLFQSIDWADRLELRLASEEENDDGIASWSGGHVVDGFDNLAWRAVAAVRAATETERRLRLRLDKQIPVAAGLGGGSADAAAALHLAVRLLRAPGELVDELAPTLGSDVPFCAIGGTALVTGRGDVVEPLDPIGGYALGLVVPPVELSTPRVFAKWDELGGPAGVPLPHLTLPPVLRPHAPVVNDLYPAAVAVAPPLDDWRSELQAAWGRPVLMSGSGPTLLAFFLDHNEADAAMGEVPAGARAAHATVPVRRGWTVFDADEKM